MNQHSEILFSGLGRYMWKQVSGKHPLPREKKPGSSRSLLVDDRYRLRRIEDRYVGRIPTRGRLTRRVTQTDRPWTNTSLGSLVAGTRDI